MRRSIQKVSAKISVLDLHTSQSYGRFLFGIIISVLLRSGDVELVSSCVVPGRRVVATHPGCGLVPNAILHAFSRHPTSYLLGTLPDNLKRIRNLERNIP